MITKYKLFERVMNNAEIGDYVICHIKESDPEEQAYTDEFLNNNIGILKRIDDSSQNTQGWHVQFDNIPEHISDFNELSKSFDYNSKIASFYDDEIDHWGVTEEEVRMMRDTKKYNI
jgi:hypothetical protein